jgi:hypothetical protein
MINQNHRYGKGKKNRRLDNIPLSSIISNQDCLTCNGKNDSMKHADKKKTTLPFDHLWQPFNGHGSHSCPQTGSGSKTPT